MPSTKSIVLALALTAPAAALEVAARALRRLPALALAAPQRLLYDAVTALHAAAWATLRPALDAFDDATRARIARQLVEAGLTPAVVRLTAEAGCLTLYDSAMVHRGGCNVGDAPRPILAVHLRANGDEYGMGE